MTITPFIWFSIIVISAWFAITVKTLISDLIDSYEVSMKDIIFSIESQKIKPFIVSEYYDRIEKAALDILEDQKPVDQIIILWWGFDGLRLNENGELEWISRKKQKPVNQNICYQPAQSMAQASYPLYGASDMCQSSQATREQFFGIKMQLEMMKFNAALQNQMQGINSALQSYVIQPPAYTAYLTQLTDCCCNKKRI